MGNPWLQLASLFLALLGAACLPGHEAFRSMKSTTFDSPTTPPPPPSRSPPPPSPHSPPPPTHHDPPPGSPPPPPASPSPPPPLTRHDSPPSVVHRRSPPPPASPPAPDAEITPTPVVHREPPAPPPTKQSHPPPPAPLSPPPPIQSAHIPVQYHAASERKLLEDGSYSFHVGSAESLSDMHHDQSRLPSPVQEMANDETSLTANHAAEDTIFENELHHQVPNSPLEDDHQPMSLFQSEKRLFEEEHFPVPNGGSSKKCGISDPPAPTPAIAPVSGGPVSVPSPYGGYAPVGSPFYQPGDPGAPSPAPTPTAGSDEGRQPYYDTPSPPSSNSTVAHTTMVSAMQYNQCTYTIIASTGNIEGAGTTADVNAEFFDRYGNSVLFVNLKSQNKNFERGTTDTFTIVGDCVQNICRMHLSHDDSGLDPSWFVDTVTVSLLYQTHVFNVFEWLSKTEPPYSLTKTVSSCPNA